MAKKLMSGDGWSFEPAGAKTDGDIVSLPDEKQRAAVRLEKRPRGREATTVTGFVLSDPDRKALAAELRRACGTGGSDAPGRIEVQGDHCAKVRGLLENRGWRVK